MFWVSRASLGLARRKRLALGLLFDSCVCVRVCGVFILYIHNRQVLHRQLCECSTHQIAHPGSLRIHLADYVYGSPRRFARFTSCCMIRGAPIYPRHRDLYPTRRDSDRCLLLADCLHSWVAQGVENVLHVTWLPYRCMTSSQLTRL